MQLGVGLGIVWERGSVQIQIVRHRFVGLMARRARGCKREKDIFNF